MKKILFTLMLALPLVAAADKRLFKQYEHGTSYDEIKQLDGVESCLEDALCLEGQKFAGYDVIVIFVFDHQQLGHIVLAMNHAETVDEAWEQYAAVMKVLSTKFTAVKASSGDYVVDNIKALRANDPDAFAEAKAGLMERAEETNTLTMILVNDAYLKGNPDKVSKVRNAERLFWDAGPDIRVVELFIKEKMLLIKFQRPELRVNKPERPTIDEGDF